MQRVSLRVIAVAAIVCALIIPGTALALQERTVDVDARSCMQQGACDALDGAGSKGCVFYGSTTCPNYADENNDGTCDNAAIGACRQGQGYIDADGNGTCDNYEDGACNRKDSRGWGQNRADDEANGDGFGNGYGCGFGNDRGNGYGCGNGYGHGCGNGHGCGRTA